jgi:DNA-directed RNA polymerase I, II, and III subunit RPABC2
MSDYESDSNVSERSSENERPTATAKKYKSPAPAATKKTTSLANESSVSSRLPGEAENGDDEEEDDGSSVATENDEESFNIQQSGDEEDDENDEDVERDGTNPQAPFKLNDLTDASDPHHALHGSDFPLGFDSGDEDDVDDLEEDLEDDNYLQKLDNRVREETIRNFHPELMVHNYDEVAALATVVRNAEGAIVDPLHRTLPFLTKYERARILGERARQINEGATPFVKVETGVIDGYLIAEEELLQRRIPFIIQRPLSNGASEFWRVADLELL